MVDTVRPEQRADSSRTGGDGVGIAAFVAGCLALGPVAIVLGIIGLRRLRSGAASQRRWPLAGLILGIVGTLGAIVLAAGVALSPAPAAEQDLRARADAVTLGNAAVAWFVENPRATAVAVEVDGDGYRVEGTEVPSGLAPGTSRDVTVEGTDAYDWCLTLTYDGGTRDQVAYAATSGLRDSCAAG